MLHLSLLDGGQTKLLKMHKSFGAQLTLTFIEGGLFRRLSQGASLRWSTFQLPLVPLPTLLKTINLFYVVVR